MCRFCFTSTSCRADTTSARTCPDLKSEQAPLAVLVRIQRRVRMLHPMRRSAGQLAIIAAKNFVDTNTWLTEVHEMVFVACGAPGPFLHTGFAGIHASPLRPDAAICHRNTDSLVHIVGASCDRITR